MLLKVVGPLLVVVACKHTTPVETAVTGPTLDVLGFEPPFEEVPVARAFVAGHHLKSITVHDVDPNGLTVQSSVKTAYDGDGAPTQTFARNPSHDFDLDLITSTIYVRDAAAMPAAIGPNDKVVLLDAKGRTAKVRTAHDEENWSYDVDGRLARIGREADGKHYEELRTFDGAGQLIKRTRGEVGQPPFETLEFSYDHGRPSAWRGSKPGFADDRYTFRYDAAGQLAEMRFVESGKDIYQRSYAYDADGFVTRVDQHASVPAMGNETFIYEYELADGKRSPIPVVFPGPPPQKTDADVIAELGAVFHPIAGSARVVWNRSDPKKPYPVTVTFDVPAKDAAELTPVDLAARACSLRQALQYQCDCEALERGPVHAGAVTLTFHVNLGC